MKAISVRRKVKIDGKWELLPVAKKNGQYDWANLLHRGVPITTMPGTFYLDWRENGNRIRRAVGDHAREAKIALATQKQVVNLREEGMEVDDAPQIRPLSDGIGAKIADVILDFRKHPPLTLRKKSYAKYRNALISFGRWTNKTHLNQLERDDLKRFMSHLVDKEKLDPSTAVDKATIVLTVMKDRGASIVMKKGDWPRVTEKQRGVYEHETLEKLFEAADPHERALFQTFLLSGFRDQEVGFLAWDDFNAKKSTLRVSKKTEMGFAPKNYQEREIPIHDVLVKILVEHKKRQAPGEYLIFPTSGHNAMRGLPGGQRDRHMLDRLKRLAKRAGLNCGHCKTSYLGKKVSCEAAPVCQKFGLHMFRHTYATTMLHDGMDLVSLQFLLGHNDLASTRKYLRALTPKNMLAKVNSSSLAKIGHVGAGPPA
jgi:integrase/recombinase XerD